jgi:hypothetical protein
LPATAVLVTVTIAPELSVARLGLWQAPTGAGIGRGAIVSFIPLNVAKPAEPDHNLLNVVEVPGLSRPALS